MSKYLSRKEIAEAAIRLSNRLGVNIPNEKDICRALIKYHSMIPIYAGNGMQLWIDELYIAYSAEGDSEVNYIYLTDKHIMEEYRSYEEARKERKNNVRLPAPIDRVFKEALDYMKIIKKKYFFSK